MIARGLDSPPGKTDQLLDAPPLKFIDRVLQRWRFFKARSYIPPRSRVLDVGCADGALFRYLERRIASGVGIDPALRRSIDMQPYRLISGSVPEDLPKSGSFDVITMLAVVEHMPADKLPQLQDVCARLLNPGGRLIITVPSKRVDSILHILHSMRLIEGIALHEHHGFAPSQVPKLFSSSELRLTTGRRFQLGLNNLFVFEKTL